MGDHFWQVIGLLSATLNIVLIVISGRAAHGVTALRSSLSMLAKSIGHPDPKEISLRTGSTLVQKVETLSHDQDHLVKTVGNILVTFKREQQEFFQEVIERLPPTGKRADNGEQT